MAVVQGAVPQDEKWIADNLDAILELYKTRTREAHGADLIVWPESAIPDLVNYHIDYFREVYAEASAKGSSLVMGALRAEENPKTGEEEVFNSVLAMDRSTPGVGWHDKHHLVPFSEFFPVPGFVRNWLKLHGPAVFGLQSRRGAAGTARGGGATHRRGHLLRGRLRFDPLPVMRTATMLVNVTNDSWFGHSTARYQHLQISRAARHGSRAPHGAGRQRRRVGGHRPPRRNHRAGAGI